MVNQIEANSVSAVSLPCLPLPSQVLREGLTRYVYRYTQDKANICHRGVVDAAAHVDYAQESGPRLCGANNKWRYMRVMSFVKLSRISVGWG